MQQKTFEEDFTQFIGQRLISQGPIMLESKAYRAYVERARELFQQLSNILGPEHKSLLQEFDDAANCLMGVAEEYGYKAGLRDGIEFRKELGLPA